MKKHILTIGIILALSGCGQSQYEEEVSNKPAKEVNVKLFVMAYCPFGTQIEKGILPVVELLGDKINFDVKFVDYAMHGKKEIDEQMYQYCIQKDQSAKFLPYLKCFLEKAQSAQCINSTAVDYSKALDCVQSIDKKYNIIANFENKSSWNNSFPPFPMSKNDNLKYGVKGSPTLVINDEVVKSARDSASLLKAICAKFKNPPAECQKSLPDTTPAPGFGFDGKGADNSASCG